MKEAELSAVIREGVRFLWTWRLYSLASIPHSHIVLALKAGCHACLITGESRHSEAPPFLAAGVPRIFLSSYLGSNLVKNPHSGSKCQSHSAACVPLGDQHAVEQTDFPSRPNPSLFLHPFCTSCALIGLFGALFSCLMLVVLRCTNTTNLTVVRVCRVAALNPHQANTGEQTLCTVIKRIMLEVKGRRVGKEEALSGWAIQGGRGHSHTQTWASIRPG